MKFIDMPAIIQTNALLSRINVLDPKKSIEVELYSCKQTKVQKKHRNIKKPLRYYVSVLEETFGDFDFSGKSAESFVQITHEYLKKELSFILFTIYKNYEDVNELLLFMDNIFSSCVSVRHSLHCYIDNLFENESDNCRVFIIHDKKQKRVILIKTRQ